MFKFKIINCITLTENTTKDFKQSTISSDNELKPPEVVLRRTQSFESDEKFVYFSNFVICSAYCIVYKYKYYIYKKLFVSMFFALIIYACCCNIKYLNTPN